MKTPVAILLAAGATFCSTLLRAAEERQIYEVDVTLTNSFEKEFVNLPVFLQVFRVFGRGVDYAKFNPDGFHVFDEKDREIEFFYRSLPPRFSIADDELVLMIPRFAPGARLQFRFANTEAKNPKQKNLEPGLLVDNPNNLIPNGGF